MPWPRHREEDQLGDVLRLQRLQHVRDRRRVALALLAGDMRWSAPSRPPPAPPPSRGCGRASRPPAAATPRTPPRPTSSRYRRRCPPAPCAPPPTRH